MDAVAIAREVIAMSSHYNLILTTDWFVELAKQKFVERFGAAFAAVSKASFRKHLGEASRAAEASEKNLSTTEMGKVLDAAALDLAATLIWEARAPRTDADAFRFTMTGGDTTRGRLRKRLQTTLARRQLSSSSGALWDRHKYVVEVRPEGGTLKQQGHSPMTLPPGIYSVFTRRPELMPSLKTRGLTIHRRRPSNDELCTGIAEADAESWPARN